MVMQPGRETNYPSSSGSIPGQVNSIGKSSVGTVNGMTITVGMIAIAIVLLLVFYHFDKKGSRR